MTTRPAHIAMFSIAAHGHVNPSIEVIRELVARGHRVTYAIPPAFAEKVAETGAEPKLWHSTLPTDEDPEAWGTELIDNIEPFLADALQAEPQLAAAYAGDEPDLVLYDITAYPARVLAHRWGVPIVQLSPNLVAWEGYDEEVGKPLFEPLKRTPRGKAFYGTFARWIAENGMDLSVEDFMGRPDRCLVLIPRALQPNADRVDEKRYTFVGACQGDRAAQGDWRRPADAEKVLLVAGLQLHQAAHLLPRVRRVLRRAAGLACRTADRPLRRPRGAGGAARQCGGPPVGAPARDPPAGRRVRHARRCGRQPGRAGHRHPDGRRTAGRRPVRQRRHAPGAGRGTPSDDGTGHRRDPAGDGPGPGRGSRGGAPPGR